MNLLYYGDNLDGLRETIPPEIVDLCYIDPPFNSKRHYNQIYNNIGTSSPSCVRLCSSPSDSKHDLLVDRRRQVARETHEQEAHKGDVTRRETATHTGWITCVPDSGVVRAERV